ncbi:MAG: cell division protein FtsK [Rhodospirillaceae bacterium]|nr:cell division protein FtsK [Rhodospirillaceae bacterium]
MSLSDRGLLAGGWLENTPPFFKRRLAEVIGIGLLTAVVLIIGALSTYTSTDPSMNTSGSHQVNNLMGAPGAIVADLLLQFLGIASLGILLVLGAWGFRLLSHRPLNRILLRLLFLPVSLLAIAPALTKLSLAVDWPLEAGLGGVVGAIVFEHLKNMTTHFDFPQFASLFILTSTGLFILLWCMGVKWAEWITILTKTGVKSRVLFLLGKRGGVASAKALQFGFRAATKAADQKKANSVLRTEPSFSNAASSSSGVTTVVKDHRLTANQTASKVLSDNQTITLLKSDNPQQLDRRAKRRISDRQETLDLIQAGEYQFPALGLLSVRKQKHRTLPDANRLEANARLLETVLQDFGIKGEIVQVRSGPVVTLYELQPAPGTKSSRVIGLADDIARSMSAVSVRVAVVPGRNVIGIELPNNDREMVFLREMLETQEYVECIEKLPIALGKDISGSPVVVDLARMPHLLIAGTTGSGKSVAVNTMILSLLYRMTPEQCRMIMIDPKMLELSIYDNIPHLLSPVVTDPKKAVVALKWTVREMESRYRAMSKLGVRNIDGYNARLAEARKKGEVLKRRVQTGFDNETGKPVFEDQPLDLTPFPFIVVVIDEVADLMLVAGKDIEGAVQRLAQMARAAGIHVIMATQRPSVDVITGTIKANFPTRISFQVTSKIDSRTILGEQGAEQLLGQGDMLHMAGGGKVTRVHGPFVSDEEVEDVVQHLRTQGEPEFNDSVTEEDDVGDPLADYGMGIVEKGGETGDELYDQAVAIVARERKASTSFIQRHLKIGYNRAATIIECMETNGVVSGANHVGKREVLLPDHSEL